MKFRRKPAVIDAERWHRNGDHPEDDVTRGILTPHAKEYEGKVVRRFRSPDVDGKTKCGLCGTFMHDHGWIDNAEGGHKVCPGDWIITNGTGEYHRCSPGDFREMYDPAERSCMGPDMRSLDAYMEKHFSRVTACLENYVGRLQAGLQCLAQGALRGESLELFEQRVRDKARSALGQ